ncbi:MAG: hypothetical protein ACP5NX_03180 [Candidatus Bilamarchaeaceae archaeon]
MGGTKAVNAKITVSPPGPAKPPKTEPLLETNVSDRGRRISDSRANEIYEKYLGMTDDHKKNDASLDGLLRCAVENAWSEEYTLKMVKEQGTLTDEGIRAIDDEIYNAVFRRLNSRLADRGDSPRMARRFNEYRASGKSPGQVETAVCSSFEFTTD